MENLITAKEAAEFLHIKKNTLHIWIRTKKDLPVLRTGRRVKFLPSELMQWVRKQEGEYQQKQAGKKDKDTKRIVHCAEYK